MPPGLVDQLYALVEGATVSAVIFTVNTPAAVARMATALISVAAAA